MFFKSCFSLTNFVIMDFVPESEERSRLFWRSIRLVRSAAERVWGEFRILFRRRSGVIRALGERPERGNLGCWVSLITPYSSARPFGGLFAGCFGCSPLIGYSGDFDFPLENLVPEPWFGV